MLDRIRDDEEICGKCKYHRYDIAFEEWYCANKQSENWAEITQYDDECEDWEGRN